MAGVPMFTALFAALTLWACFASAWQCEDARYESKPRTFIMTDISNEPDDQMSLVRLLVHANELDLQGIAVVTSVWKNDSLDLTSAHNVMTAYGEVTDNLNANVPESGTYPNGDEVLSKLYAGHPVYGLAALELPLSNGSTALINATDASNEPLWVCAWGGANVLAEALNHVNQTRSDDEVAAFVNKLRVYSISDQDNSGAWIRVHFPTLFYIVSLHGFSEYALATWIVSTLCQFYPLVPRLTASQGISGEVLRPFDQGGPDTSIITNEWLQEHIRLGTLGAYYLNWSYIMEGDTPSFLGLLPNGLNAPEHPEWGGWGGRYMLLDASGWTSVYSDAVDFAIGADNGTFYSKYASIWRWRPAFQYDFTARMQWSVQPDYAENNHHPVAVVNDTCGFEAFELHYTLGESVVLDASASYDPDGDDISFDWFHYRDPSLRLEGDIPRISPNVTFASLNNEGSIVSVTPQQNIVSGFVLVFFESMLMKSLDGAYHPHN